MDPFEEFEFKPLTDGLGFHKKKPAASAKNAIEDTTPNDPFAKNTLKSKGLELLEEPSTNQLRPPLPRKNRTTLPSAPGNLTEVGGDGSAAVDEILKTLQKNRRFDFDNSKQKQKISQAPQKQELKKSVWSFSAAILDTMLVVAASLLCMIVVLIATKADLIGNISNPDAQGMIYVSMFAVLAGVCFTYLVGNRIFVGCTPGEWAFDQCVGKPEELNTVSYTLGVIGRSLFVIATGFVILPILSVLMNKDIAGNITGARLYKKA